MRPLDWKDWTFALALIIAAIIAGGWGYESALTRNAPMMEAAR